MSRDADPYDEHARARAQAEAENAARLTRETEESDIRWLMSSKRGRRIVWRQLDRAGVFRLSFNTNAMQMAFAEGNRNEGLRLLSQVHALCPEQYPQMVKEQTSDKRNTDAGSRNAH